ncbi:YpdA family putative bacillithiol disulfide reductase [Flavobacteriaceae bacterium 14752]|uniref:YpdA family putative bacillithiol disulfide reductase n=1 Tax=Mesohalobacter salilacus TaxID=2491711 RepID=UPI000F633ADE|nr:YpdA family putative bacillithiol disulfide reductase [Flavobacteriaceae bacterium 14752]
MTYDILIIGGGPIGLACGLEAKKRNLSYVIIEKGALVNSLYHYPTNMTFFSTSEKLEIDGIPFISKNPKPTKQEALEYYRRVATSNGLNINLFESVKNVDKPKKTFRIKTSKGDYKAKHIIIATGFYDIPNTLEVPGEDLEKVFHYYNDPHYFVNQDVIVVGASNSAVDAALEIYRKGGRVTMIVRGDDIGQRVKYWVRPDIKNRIDEGSIKAYFNAEITEIKKDTVEFKDENDKIQQIKNDYVLALTGYKPNFDFLKKLGVKLSSDKTRVPEYNKQTMETNVNGLYLAGVICGGMETHKWFIENSRIHAKMIVEDIT